jgi:hypothetical protein
VLRLSVAELLAVLAADLPGLLHDNNPVLLVHVASSSGMGLDSKTYL